MGEPRAVVDRDIREPRVPDVVIHRAVADVLRLRQAMAHLNVTEEESLAWTAASLPAFIEAEELLHEREHHDAMLDAGYR
jgi:hypothetical protein